MTAKSTPDFPRWIPSAARDRILELRQGVVSTPEELVLLDRLATYEVMRTEVWQKLPPSAVGMEGRIIDWTVAGLRLAAARFPKNKAESERLAKYNRLLAIEGELKLPVISAKTVTSSSAHHSAK